MGLAPSKEVSTPIEPEIELPPKEPVRNSHTFFNFVLFPIQHSSQVPSSDVPTTSVGHVELEVAIEAQTPEPAEAAAQRRIQQRDRITLVFPNKVCGICIARCN